MSIATPPSPSDSGLLPELEVPGRVVLDPVEQGRMEDVEAFLDRYPNRRFEDLARGSRLYLDRWKARHCPGARVLVVCCGDGRDAVAMARLGASEVVGIDPSDGPVAGARREAEAAGVADRARFLVMGAGRMTFPDDSFDVIVADGCLHRLDLAAAFGELRRVVRPAGRILCTGALAHNPIVMAYRRRTPHLRAASEVDRILRVEDIRRARSWFARVDLRFFHLAAIAALPLRRSAAFGPSLAVLDAIDGVILRVPGVRRWAWRAIATLSGPKGKEPGRLGGSGIDG